MELMLSKDTTNKRTNWIAIALLTHALSLLTVAPVYADAEVISQAIAESANTQACCWSDEYSAGGYPRTYSWCDPKIVSALYPPADPALCTIFLQPTCCNIAGTATLTEFQLCPPWHLIPAVECRIANGDKSGSIGGLMQGKTSSVRE